MEKKRYEEGNMETDEKGKNRVIRKSIKKKRGGLLMK